MEKSNVK